MSIIIMRLPNIAIYIYYFSQKKTCTRTRREKQKEKGELKRKKEKKRKEKKRHYSACFDRFVRNFINKYTIAYELNTKITTIPASRQP